MNKVAGLLASYIIEKGVVKEEYREVYEYGFTILLEMVSFVVFSVAVSLYLHMVLEGILFFVIFILLRSYAGGLHLNNFYACFVLSDTMGYIADDSECLYSHNSYSYCIFNIGGMCICIVSCRKYQQGSR